MKEEIIKVAPESGSDWDVQEKVDYLLQPMKYVLTEESSIEDEIYKRVFSFSAIRKPHTSLIEKEEEEFTGIA